MVSLHQLSLDPKMVPKRYKRSVLVLVVVVLVYEIFNSLRLCQYATDRG